MSKHTHQRLLEKIDDLQEIIRLLNRVIDLQERLTDAEERALSATEQVALLNCELAWGKSKED